MSALGNTFLSKVQYFTVGYCSYYEYLSHTLIAYNRYSVMTLKLNDNKVAALLAPKFSCS